MFLLISRLTFFAALLGDPLRARGLAPPLLPLAEPEPGGGVHVPQGAGGAQGVRAVRGGLRIATKHVLRIDKKYERKNLQVILLLPK